MSFFIYLKRRKSVSSTPLRPLSRPLSLTSLSPSLLLLSPSLLLLSPSLLLLSPLQTLNPLLPDRPLLLLVPAISVVAVPFRAHQVCRRGQRPQPPVAGEGEGCFSNKQPSVARDRGDDEQGPFWFLSFLSFSFERALGALFPVRLSLQS